ncbi:Presenilins-associated rhomboid-like protein, mitochondrial [Trachymyrmex cornetzi]|uniref:rhomboid protease n=1 Tax=Trachymyrmex cornetzi TaxID=471704 RepID=A0A151JNT4_9HYME|nr:Presenilins-associated rhomboid-like protein, mitochondrial [Trachymyrmex cornetzi]
MTKKKVLYHHDNAPSHTSLKAMVKLDQLRFKLVAHPPYSPDLAPSDYYLFPNLKRWLQGKRFRSNEEVIAEIEFSGATIAGAAIWEYERIRSQTYRLIHRYRQFRIKRTGWKSEMESWWQNLTEGQKMFVPICFINAVIFLVWRVPTLQKTMVRYFCANPASSASCWSMVFSTFSHYSIIHLAANMYVLHSFSTIAVTALGKEQFLALYLSSGVISSFVSHMYKSMFGMPGLSLGAKSGAIMGILGFVCIQYPDIRLSIVFLPILTFTAGMAIKGIMALDVVGCILGWKYFDHAAHLGGALFGIFWQVWGNTNIWQKREPLLSLWHEFREPPRS